MRPSPAVVKRSAARALIRELIRMPMKIRPQTGRLSLSRRRRMPSPASATVSGAGWGAFNDRVDGLRRKQTGAVDEPVDHQQ